MNTTTQNPLDQIDPDDITGAWTARHLDRITDAELLRAACQTPKSPVLLDGIHHIAILSSDTDRLVDFYQKVFDATLEHSSVDGPVRLTFVNIGPHTELNVFEIDGNHEAEHQTPMFGRGRLDHVGLRASSIETFSEIRRRLIDLEATDGFVTDFGPVLSLFFTDPDGLEGEVCVPNPDAQPDVRHPPGTPSPRFDAP